MSKISEAKKRVRLEAWAGMYNEFLASGKTVKEWCEENRIAKTTFHNRLRQVREAALEPKHEIVAVNAAAEQPCITEIPRTIQISGRGITAEMPADVSPELLTALLKGLSSC